MTSVLITGSSRGIGLELVRKLASHPDSPGVIIATCRDPSKAEELQSIAKEYPNVKILRLDIEKIDKFPEIVSQVESIVGNNGLNILINNAGIACRKDSLDDFTYDEYMSVLKTNVVAPTFLTRALLPLLKKSAALKTKGAKGIRQTAVLNMSSILGSVSSKHMTVWAYNESKAALNQATRSFSSILNGHGIITVALHPGWVRTDMGGPNATLSVQESVSGLVNIIYNLSPSQDDKFVSHDGSELPW